MPHSKKAQGLNPLADRGVVRFKFSLWVLWFVATPQRHHVRLTSDSTLAEGAEDWYPVQGVTCILT